MHPTSDTYPNPYPLDICLETVLEGYITAAMWSSTDETDETGGNPLDDNYDANDLAPNVYEQMRADCRAFLKIVAALGITDADLIDECVGSRGASYEEHIGHDLWLTRNSHGCGFWDGDPTRFAWVHPAITTTTSRTRRRIPAARWGAIGDRLSMAAQALGSADLYLGDDINIHYWSN